MDYSTTEINFLGVTVTKVCNKLETDLYCKPNDTHQHLHALSCHRNVYKISIDGDRLQGVRGLVQ